MHCGASVRELYDALVFHSTILTSVDAGHLGASLSEWYIEYNMDAWAMVVSTHYITTVNVLVMKSRKVD